MSDALFLTSEEFTAIVGYVGEFVGFGVALGCIFWMLGYVVWFVVDALKGGF